LANFFIQKNVVRFYVKIQDLWVATSMQVFLQRFVLFFS